MSTFDMSTCSNCKPGRVCQEHKRVMRDGEVIRVPMWLMDGVQSELAARGPLNDARQQAVRDNAAAGERTLATMRDQSARVAAFADHYTAKAAKRDAELTRNGYDKSLDFKPYAA